MANSNRCTGCRNLFLAQQPHHCFCWSCWHVERDKSGVPAFTHTPTLDSSTLRAAVALTHPDRHPPKRGEEAARVTQALTAALTRGREL